jgi:hypothetical protein
VTTARYRRAAGVLEKTVGETFFLFAPRGGFYGFDGVGREIWDLVAAGRSIEEIVRAVAEAYDADPLTVRADVAEFVRDVLDQGLVEVVPDAG